MTHKKIEEIMIHLEIIPKDVNVDIDDDLLEKYLVDSFKFIEFIVQIEESFDIEMDEEDVLVEKFNSIRAIANMVDIKRLKKDENDNKL